jgi:protein phosphatase
MAMVGAGHASCVVGNHDIKFKRWLDGHKVTTTHGLERTIEQFADVPEPIRCRIARFIDSLPVYLWLDGGRLVVAHAGIERDMIGRMNGHVRHFCIYGDTDGKSDAQGLVIRYNWALAYDGPATVVYGHIPVAEPAWVNNTVCIDTGCCFGNALTAFRWPEQTVVSVPAVAEHWKSVRRFGLPGARP